MCCAASIQLKLNARNELYIEICTHTKKKNHLKQEIKECVVCIPPMNAEEKKNHRRYGAYESKINNKKKRKKNGKIREPE